MMSGAMQSGFRGLNHLISSYNSFPGYVQLLVILLVILFQINDTYPMCVGPITSLWYVWHECVHIDTCVSFGPHLSFTLDLYS